MDNYYNIEDTAKLMTMPSGDRRKKIIILAIVAVIAIAAVVFIGFRNVAEEKYTAQIIIAEKALKEGDYEQAETAYLAAVEMNDRKPKAKEGLAYTYALESKFEESKKIYDDLYEETKEDKYKDASDRVGNEELPVIEGITPEDLWINIDPERMPKYYDAEAFLSDYMTWYYLFRFFDDSGDIIEDFRYDCEDPGDSYVMTFAYTYLEPDAIEFVYDEDDPWGWSTGTYEIEDKAAIDGVMADVFHADSDKMEDAIGKLEDRGMMYLEGDSYYQFFPATGGPIINATINDVWIGNGKFCIEYEAIGDDNGPETINGDPYIGTFYAVMNISGKDVANGWAMYYNGEEMPEYIAEALTPEKDEEQVQGDDGGSEDTVFSQLEGATFVFSSGAGGWGTNLEVHPDGTFDGEYHDSDMGVTGDGYPNGTLTRSVFSGKFSAPQKVDEYTYRFKVESLTTEEEPGEEYIEDETLIVTAEPYGVSNGDTVELYLPGKKGSELPASFKEWMLGVADESEYKNELAFYGLYIGEYGFAGRK